MIHSLALCLAVVAPPALAQTDPELLPKADQPSWNAVGRVNVAGLKRRQMCTGTLVAEDLVLTAAHCLFRDGRAVRADDVHFVAGWRGGDYAAHSVAAEIFIDPDHDPDLPPLSATARNDIAFLRLADPIQTVASLPLAALPAGDRPLR